MLSGPDGNGPIYNEFQVKLKNPAVAHMRLF